MTQQMTSMTQQIRQPNVNGTNDIFNDDFSRRYDAYNSGLAVFGDNLYSLTGLLLAVLPEDANVLCIGAGTGKEMLHLADAHPGWHFTGVDPSPDMLRICGEKLRQAGISARCTLINGVIDDVPAGENYHVVICMMVTHFIVEPARQEIYRQMAARLKQGGKLVIAEIAADMAADDFKQQLLSWTAMHEVASQTTHDPEEIRAQFNQRLRILPPAETELLMVKAGFNQPYHFFQALLIHAWIATK